MVFQKDNLVTTRELERTAEQQKIGRAAVGVARMITSRYPQAILFNGENWLGYSIRGSLATILWSQASAAAIVNKEMLPKVTFGPQEKIPGYITHSLRRFIRPIGDFDFKSTEWYAGLKGGIRKGGSILHMDIPYSLIVGVNMRDKEYLGFDRVGVESQQQIVMLTIGDNNFFVPTLEEMCAKKEQYLLTPYVKPPGQIRREVSILSDAVWLNSGELARFI